MVGPGEVEVLECACGADACFLPLGVAEVGFGDGESFERGEEEEGGEVELVAEEWMRRDVVVVDDARNRRVGVGDVRGVQGRARYAVQSEGVQIGQGRGDVNNKAFAPGWRLAL